MFYALFVFRRRKRDTSEGEHFEGNTVLEILWTVVPLVLAGHLLVYRLADACSGPPDGGDDIRVAAVGFQVGLDFRLPQWGRPAPRWCCPRTNPALISLTSTDVIHSFWVADWAPSRDVRTWHAHAAACNPYRGRRVQAELC
jgi:cytochrome c oxidase subunit 2